MNQTKIVVLGAGYAGMLSALRLARKTSAQITLVNAAPIFVERVRLHQQASGQAVIQRPIAELVQGTGIDFVQGMVTQLDPANHCLSVNTAAGEQKVNYDTLLYALGSTIDQDSVEGVRDYAEVLLPDRIAPLHQKLANLPSGAKLVICGGGLTGIETATELAESYPQLEVRLVTSGELGANLSMAGRAYLQTVFKRLNITIQDDTRIERLNVHEIETDKGNFAYDVAIWTGSFTIPALAQEAGIQTNARGQILVDNCLRSVSHPDIYGAGDSAYPAELQPALRMACATALPMAMQVVKNIAAMLEEKPQQPLHFRYYLQCISLGRHDGLVQFVKSNDAPHERILTGRVAAFVKEQICRYVSNTSTKNVHSVSKSAYPAHEAEAIDELMTAAEKVS